MWDESHAPRSHLLDSCFTPDDWQTLAGVNVSTGDPEGLHDLTMVLEETCPFTGHAVWQTHFAFYSLEQIKERTVNLLFWEEMMGSKMSVNVGRAEYLESGPLNRSCPLRWNVIGPLQPFTGDSVAALPASYTPTLGIEVVTFAALHFLKHRRFPQFDVRCMEPVTDTQVLNVRSDGSTLEVRSFPHNDSGGTHFYPIRSW